MAGGGHEGPSRVVEHRNSELLTDAETLKRRIDAVTAVADAVEQTGPAADQPDQSRE